LHYIKFMRGSEVFTYVGWPINRSPPWPGEQWHLWALTTAEMIGAIYVDAGLWPGPHGKRRLLARMVQALLARCGISYSVETVLEVLTDRWQEYEVWGSERL
jgi:hypothetical protein